ncbi:DUF7575 domain-containing protein [Haloferax denitrificans]|uniref:DUF7575 domain-containing protein n=1 Tax=Haloferax denitrificans TaxID=35745 RepID=UPI003C705A72
MSALTKHRPWLAAILGLVLTGLGHLYLRRWRRAALWVLLTFAVSALFVPPEAFDPLTGGAAIPPSEFAAVLGELVPILVVSFASVLDAFFLGLRQAAARAERSAVEDAEESAATVADPDADAVTCPECGREVDADIDFCHWCTTRLDEPIDR